jgi:hypothetical protein
LGAIDGRSFGLAFEAVQCIRFSILLLIEIIDFPTKKWEPICFDSHLI